MDPSVQPNVLRVLTQVEEMLIARVTPILQVTGAHGGQFKYSGHTISFPQDIQTITKYLPRKIDQLDVLILRRLMIATLVEAMFTMHSYTRSNLNLTTRMLKLMIWHYH